MTLKRWANRETLPEHHTRVVQDPYDTAFGRSHRYPPSDGDAAPDLGYKTSKKGKGFSFLYCQSLSSVSVAGDGAL